MSRVAACLILLATASACPGPGPEQIAEDMGLTRYLGAAEIAEELDTPELGDSVTYTFADDGDTSPVCMRGDPFRVGVRDTGSPNLVFFMQGGGACWDDFCLAVTAAAAGVPDIDILNPELPENPVSDWNAMHLPYCDGSLFAGDANVDEDGDGRPDRLQRGLANVSAALDVARETFPDPERVLFMGSSAGAIGAMLNMPLARHVWPDAELLVISDSGVGVARGELEPEFVASLMSEFNASSYLPPGCPDCIADGHLAPLVDWYLAQDTELRYALFTAWYDIIIGDMFMDVPAEQFQADIAVETARTAAAFPDRYKRFVIDGGMHTTLIGDPSGVIGSDLGAVELPPGSLSLLSDLELGTMAGTRSRDGLGIDAWVAGFLADDDRWVDVVDEPGEAPVWESRSR